VLLGEKPVAGTVDGGGDTAGEVVDFSEAELWGG
jgi:hypothetical protein